MKKASSKKPIRPAMIHSMRPVALPTRTRNCSEFLPLLWLQVLNQDLLQAYIHASELGILAVPKYMDAIY